MENDTRELGEDPRAKPVGLALGVDAVRQTGLNHPAAGAQARLTEQLPEPFNLPSGVADREWGWRYAGAIGGKRGPDIGPFVAERSNRPTIIDDPQSVRVKGEVARPALSRQPV